ncbi:hypothetical protein Q5M85_20740 [Paraclostridium bifermentans]|nr:hypothetical protein [Paraclostridium bifermentans]
MKIYNLKGGMGSYLNAKGNKEDDLIKSSSFILYYKKLLNKKCK